jgi:hypothetical protein
VSGRDGSPSGALAALATAAAVAVCCAGGLVASAGVLGVLGAALRRPGVVLLGLALLGLAALLTVRRVRAAEQARRRGGRAPRGQPRPDGDHEGTRG